jgi:hypothetical protein
MWPPPAGGTSPPACGHGGITPGYQGSPAQGQWNPYNPSWGSVPPEPLGPSHRTLIIGAVSTPQNHAYLANEMKQGYTAGLACQVEVGGGPPPANLADWLAGCTDALHDLGFKP